METLTVEIKTAKARKLIDDLIDLGIISLKTDQSTWVDVWNKVERKLPQTEPDTTEDEIMSEIKAYRLEKRIKQTNEPV
ncbi:hypothetical protein [Spirosoma validum]|uniref:Uncharacterized protein n=1 Tax=Spirosoma validum TaxID=2771355 RepID=A0A927GBR8_9BACT|nr:hypothetical protein [Spirosoma validum]MBD2751765.1 hypothetical protein [Spirosoma validum]